MSEFSYCVNYHFKGLLFCPNNNWFQFMYTISLAFLKDFD